MELRFSNHRVSLNVFDNSKTILSKISSILETLPKYLIIENLNNIKYQSGDVDVIDILSELKSDNFNFSENQILNIKSLKNVNIQEDIINVFIYYNKLIEETIKESPKDFILIRLKDYIDKNRSVYDFMKEYLKKDDDNMTDYIYTVYKTRKTMNAKIQSEIRENNNNNKKILEQLETVNITEDDFEESTTEFVLEKYNIDMVIKHKIINLLYLFNDCHTTDEVSFIYFNNFYKVNNNYHLDDKEISIVENEKIDTENTIVFRVLNNVKKNTCSNCYITINDANEIVVSFIYNVEFDDIEIIKERIMKSINVLKDNVKIEINRYNNSGYYYMNGMNYNIYMIRDMILNDNFINQYMITNEFNISKTRKFKKQRDNIFLYSLRGILGEFKCSLSQQYKSFYERKFYKDENQDVSVVRIRLINIDDENIDNIKLYMYKFLRYYKIQEETLIKEYKSLNPEFEDSFKDKTRYKIDKNYFTEILGKGYKRVCQRQKQPVIISEEEKNDEKYKYYIEFPKNSNSKIYTCDQNNEFKYVGLVALNNKPVPCCFTTDRRKTKIFEDYYGEEEIDKITSKENISIDKQQLIITTNKAVFKDNLGKLPENIEKMFNMSLNDTEYLRKGVNRGKKCFLECVLKALGIMKKYSNSVMKEELKKLASRPECCKQEMYDESLEEIKRKILDEETYLDPKLYINLLSQFYDCNIILFTRDSENPKGTLQIPRNIKGYFKHNLVKKNTVFIYEHLGSHTNNLQYPTCEYIVDTNMKNVYMEYQTNKFFLKLVNKIFYETEGSIFYNNMNTKVESEFLKNEKLEFLSQEINNFGKTVSLNVSYKENVFTIETSPIQPLLLPITKLKQPISYKLIQEFIKNILNSYVGEDIESNDKNSIQFIIGTVEYNIKYYVNEKKKNTVYMKNSKNLYEKFNMNMKNSKYLMKNVFCMFSRYLNEKNEEVSIAIDREFVLEFLENSIIINDDFYYDELIKPEINKKGYIYKNNKIIITTQMKEKVIFALIKENMSMNNKKFIEMYDSMYIKDYYIDVNDLHSNNKEIIIGGNIESLKSIVDNNNIKYKYFNKLRINEERYFLHNRNIDNVLFLCVKCKNIKECINLFINKELNNNLNKNDKEIPKELINNINYKYTLYSYVNMDNITEYSVRGENNEYGIKIIATKKDGENVFFALL
mgnify:CR=1 FL=1